MNYFNWHVTRCILFWKRVFHRTMFGCAKKKAVAATATAGPLTKTLWQQLQVADELPCEGTLSMLLFKGTNQQ